MNPFAIDEENNVDNECDDEIDSNPKNHNNFSFSASDLPVENSNSKHRFKKSTKSMSISQISSPTKMKYTTSGIGGGILNNTYKARDKILEYDWNECISSENHREDNL